MTLLAVTVVAHTGGLCFKPNGPGLPRLPARRGGHDHSAVVRRTHQVEKRDRVDATVAVDRVGHDGTRHAPAILVRRARQRAARDERAGVPSPCFMLRQPIQHASGAMRIWFEPPSEPTMMPIVCVP